MGINLGQGLAAFAGGALDRAREIDKEVADRVKTLKASKPDELLKSRYKKEYEKFDKEQATLSQVTSAGGPNTEPGQMALGGFGTNTDEYRKQLAADPTLYFEMRDAPTAPKYTPTDYNLNGPNTIQRLWARATGDDKTADKGEIEATAGTTTSFERGAGKEQTPEGRERMNTWRRNIPKKDDRLDVEKKADLHFLKFSNPEMFPEYKGASVSALKRLAYDVAAGTVKVTADGLPYNVQQETITSYSNDLFKKTAAETTAVEQDTDEGYVPLAERKATQTAAIKAKKDAADLAKKLAEEDRAENRGLSKQVLTRMYSPVSSPHKAETAFAKNFLQQQSVPITTIDTEGKQVVKAFEFDELGKDDQNILKYNVTADALSLMKQGGMPSSEAYDLSFKIHSHGVKAYDINILEDITGDDFTYQKPEFSWSHIRDIYLKHIAENPTLTYEKILDDLTKGK